MDMHFTADGIVSLKAKSKKGSVYDEVYVDDDALYDLIIQTFYTEEQSEGESKVKKRTWKVIAVISFAAAVILTAVVFADLYTKRTCQADL